MFRARCQIQSLSGGRNTVSHAASPDGNQLKQKAQGLTLALLLTICYGTGQAALSASVSPSVKQRSKGV